MNEKELMPETELKQLLEEAAQNIPDEVNLWPSLQQRLQTIDNESLRFGQNSKASLPTTKTQTDRPLINWPKITKIGLGLAAGLALALVILSLILTTGKSENQGTPVAIPATRLTIPTVSNTPVTGTLQATLSGHTEAVRIVAWSPDGKTLASASEDRTVKLWDSSGKLLNTVADFVEPIYSLAWKPNSNSWVASDNQLRDTQGKVIENLGATFAGWSPEGKIAVYRLKNNEIQLQNTKDQTQISTISIPAGFLGEMAWSPDGKTLATGGQNVAQGGPSNIRVWLWNTTTGMEWTILRWYTFPITSLTWSPDNKTLAVSAKGAQQAHLWKSDGTSLSSAATSGRLYSEALTESTDDYVIWSLEWSPNGKLLAGVCSDNKIRLWNADAKLMATLSGHTEEIWSVAWSPDGKTLASGAGDKTVRLWKISY